MVMDHLLQGKNKTLLLLHRVKVVHLSVMLSMVHNETKLLPQYRTKKTREQWQANNDCTLSGKLSFIRDHNSP